jgi:hypothetical protein
MMKHYFLKGMAVVILVVGFFPALVTAKSTQDLFRSGVTIPKVQPSALTFAEKKAAGFSWDNYNKAMGKPSGITTNPSRGRGLGHLRAGEVQKTNPKRKPAPPPLKKYCKCRDNDMTDISGIMCIEMDSSGRLINQSQYLSGNFPWTPQCWRTAR